MKIVLSTIYNTKIELSTTLLHAALTHFHSSTPFSTMPAQFITGVLGTYFVEKKAIRSS